MGFLGDIQSSMSTPTIFGPLANELGYMADKLGIITSEMENFNPSAYNSIKDFIHEFKRMREEIAKQMGQLKTTYTTAQAAMNAAASAGSASGVALALQVIIYFIKEVMDFAKCIAKMGEIIGQLVNFVRLLVIKVAQLAKLLIKLAIDTVMAYLNELNQSVLTVINEVKTTIVSWVQTHAFDPIVKKSKESIASYELLISSRSQQLHEAGKDPNMDGQILEWKAQIKIEKAVINEIADLGLSSGMYIV
jgi:hypothetical protein